MPPSLYKMYKEDAESKSVHGDAGSDVFSGLIDGESNGGEGIQDSTSVSAKRRDNWIF